MVHGAVQKPKTASNEGKVKDRSHFVKAAMGQVGKDNIVRGKQRKYVWVKLQRQQSLGILLVLAAGSVVPTSGRENAANLQHYKVGSFAGLKYGDRLQLPEIHVHSWTEAANLANQCILFVCIMYPSWLFFILKI